MPGQGRDEEYVTERDGSSMTLKVGRLPYILLALYLGTAAIYWVPGVPLAVVSAAKGFLYSGGVAGAFGRAIFFRAFYLPRGVLGVGAILIIWMAYLLVALVHGSNASLVMSEVALPVAFYLAIYLCARRGTSRVSAIVGNAGRVFLVACSVVLALSMSGFNWASPLVSTSDLAGSGLGGVRTGWSVGIALMLPFCVVGVCAWIGSRWRVLLLPACVTVLMLAQLSVGGRGGVVGSLIGIFCFFFAYRARASLIALVLLALVGGAFFPEFVHEALRLERLSSGLAGGGLDDFSSGRIYLYVEALTLVAAAPFVGYGLGVEGFSGMVQSGGHMLWLRLLGSGGILLLVPVAIFILAAAVLAMKTLMGIRMSSFSDDSGLQMFHCACSAVILAGIGVAFLEPNVVFGTFQVSAPWWAALACLVAKVRVTSAPAKN